MSNPEYSKLEYRLTVFKQFMLSKFILRQDRNKDKNICNNNVNWDFDVKPIREHLLKEIKEYFDSYDSKECIDIANMAFILWAIEFFGD